MIDLLLIISTVLATLLLFLVMWAFRRHALSTEDTALTDLIAGLFWLAASILMRGLWWDGLPSLIGRESFRSLYGYPIYGFWPNIVFHIVVIVAAWRLLRGFWLMIPEEDRGQYGVLTAAFYPRRIQLRFSRKDREDV